MAPRALSVSQLNTYIKKIITGDPLLRSVRVAGELSRVTYHRSGHLYFTLKDDNSRINCVMFRNYAEKLSVELKEGLAVTVSGYVSLYEQGGTYSINVVSLEGAEQGALALAFEQMKEKLSKEGLFDSAHKRPIPRYAKKVAVVTSDTGAALQDILKIIRSKNDLTSVLIAPCLVQGSGAPKSIASAIERVNRLSPDCDTMIVGRGGGAPEELAAFNSELVARAIYNSAIPVISAVGHEIDFSIADFVADARAETPTAAADMAVFDSFELRERIGDLKAELVSGLKGKAAESERLLLSFSPERMKAELSGKAELYEKKYISEKERLCEAMNSFIGNLEAGLEKELGILDSLSPTKTLMRGFSAVSDREGRLISSVRSIKKGDELKLRMHDGSADVSVERVAENIRR